MEEHEKSIQALLFTVTHSYMVKCFKKVADMGIHPRQIPMLKILSRQDGVSQSALCKMLGTKPSTVTVSLKRMEKADLVRREQDRKDQRVTRVYLTDKGKDIIRQMKERLKDYEETMMTGFSEAEVCLLRRMLEQIRSNLEQSPAEVQDLETLLKGEENQEC